MAANDQSTLAGIFKEVYAKDIKDLWPQVSILQDRISFDSAELVGKHYNQSVDLSLEHGVTYAGPGVTPGQGGAPFLQPSPGQNENALVAPSQLVVCSSVTYEAIARSLNDKAAFKKATSAVVKRSSATGVKRLEIELLHGRQGIGEVSANPANGASRAIVITAPSWSAGIWAGSVGASLDFYTTLGAKTNAGKVTITSINTVTRTITCSFANVGDQSLNLTTCPVIFFETASPASEMAGLDVLASLSPASAPLFGINPATYDLWNANQFNVAGQLTQAKINEASALAATYGAYGDAVCIVSPKAFEGLNSSNAALRMFDSSYKSGEGESGVRSLKFHNQLGSIEIMPHPFQKDGLAHIFFPDEAKRIGGTDLTYIHRGGSGEKLILESATSTASEMRLYTTQALFCAEPRHVVRLTGIA